MRCSDFQESLPLYGDGYFSTDGETGIETHLKECPSCRREAAEFRRIRHGLGNLAQPELPETLVSSLQRIQVSTHSERMFGSFERSVPLLQTVRHWLLPFGAGAFCSGLFIFLFISFLLVRPGSSLFHNASDIVDSARPREATDRILEEDLLRIEIPESAPEVNPAGALVALTKSIVRGNMSDQEVVVVADVFGDGLANLREIVEAPSDEAAMRELERAFNTKPEDAPFLPARMSKGTDAVRVVLKIQRVEVVRSRGQ